MKKQKKYLKILLSVILLIIIIKNNTEAKESKLLTLEEAINRTLKNNSEIQIAKESEKVDSHNTYLGILAILPNFKIAIKDTETRLNLFGPEKKSLRDQEGLVSFSMDWDIFGIPKNFTEFAIAKKQYTLRKIETNIEIETKIEETSKKYYRLVLEKYKYRILNKNLELAKERLNILEKSYQLGKISKAKYLEYQVEYNKILSDLMSQEESVIDSRFELNIILGNSENENIEVQDKIEVDKSLNWESILENFKNYNEEVKYQRINISKHKLMKASANSNLLPDISLGIKYDIVKYDMNNNWMPTTGSLALVAKLELNLINIIKSVNDKVNSSIKYKIALLQQKLKNRKLETSLKAIYLNYQHQIKKQDLENKNMEVAKENARMALTRFKKGSITSYEMHQAIQNEREAYFSLIKTLYEAKIAEIIIKKLSGTLYTEYVSKNR